MTVTTVHNRRYVPDLVDNLIGAEPIYIAIQGPSNSRNGSDLIISLSVQLSEQIVLVYTKQLGPLAFTTKSRQRKLTLKVVLETESVLMILFNVTEASKMLFSSLRHFTPRCPRPSDHGAGVSRPGPAGRFS